MPHRGWVNVGTEDLGENTQICEMCESVEIRFAHYEEHPDYPETLIVGCICAEHMECDYAAPRDREKRLKGAVRRRKSWEKRRWKRSAKGNSYMALEGFRITIMAKTHGWIIAIANQQTNTARFGSKVYGTEDAAKAAAFDALIWAKESL